MLEQVAKGRTAFGARGIIEALPAKADGTLDEAAVDDTLIGAHLELQRLSSEFRQGPRLRETLAPIFASLRAAGSKTLRLIDLGCGVGYALRWLAAHRALPDDVELIGADFNPALLGLARAAAEAEGLPVRFVEADALKVAAEAPSGAVVISTGAIHHFRGESLARLLETTSRSAAACVHVDIKPSWVAPMGAWLFHQARMRVPLARHDGLVSALRAHTARTLLDAARAAAPAWSFGVLDGRVGLLPIVRIMHSLVGVRAELAGDVEARMGRLARRLWPSGGLSS
ncbi:MAG: class I SAM-dependent methyltransferase [Myxococcaceae bacterium]|nr:class I SAM-dependent methyltransferase [Myxococcaceae bacterium]